MDSVVDCSDATLRDGSASGFMFDGMTTENLYASIQRAIGLYHDKNKWVALCKNCMAKNFSWQNSAEAYHAVYLKVLGR